jgi:hypothetical protein
MKLKLTLQQYTYQIHGAKNYLAPHVFILQQPLFPFELAFSYWLNKTRIRCHIRVNLLGFHKGRDALRPG